MSKQNITTSGFSLAKGKELTGDDFYADVTINQKYKSPKTLPN